MNFSLIDQMRWKNSFIRETWNQTGMTEILKGALIYKVAEE